MSPDTGPIGNPLSSAGSATPTEFPARTPQRLDVSFEFSPPRTEAAERTLWETVNRLTPLHPSFFSVTYGAGGSTRQRTHDTVERLKKETGIDAAAHLTCVAATRGEIDDIARAYWDAGIRHIVALRGDPPGGMGGEYTPHPDGYCNAADLVAGLKKIGNFQISVAGYPEKHPASADERADLENLKAKVDAGADRCITQFFFEADDFLRFRDRAAPLSRGADHPGRRHRGLHALGRLGASHQPLHRHGLCPLRCGRHTRLARRRSLGDRGRGRASRGPRTTCALVRPQERTHQILRTWTHEDPC